MASADQSTNALVGRVRKPGPKETREVIEARIAEIIKILESSGWTKNIESKLGAQWEVGARQVRRLKQRAAKRIAVAVAPGNLEEERAAHISRVRAVAALAIDKGDFKAAIAALRWEGQVIGLERPRELVLSGTVRGLSDEDLARKEAEYAAAMGEASS